MIKGLQAYPVNEKARKLAWEAVCENLSDQFTYRTLVGENEDQWTFQFLPDGNVRGGGAEVKVDKKTMQVAEKIFTQ